MQTYVTPFALGSLGLTVALAGVICLSALIAKQTVPPGWRALRPGLKHWFAAVGMAGISTFMAWIYLFVGSARRDAAFQMNVAFFMSIGCGLAAVYLAWYARSIKRKNIRWRRSRIVHTLPDGQEKTQDAGQAVSWWRTWTGYFALGFADGSVLYIDPYTKGSDEFMGDFGPPEDAEDVDDPRS
jgi:fluoride ion exporter CrcB/FEX